MTKIEDDRLRRFQAPITLDVVDKDGQRMDVKSVKHLIPKLMAKGGVLTFKHTDRVVGKLLYASEESPGMLMGDGMVYDVDPSDDEIWDMAKKKELGLSVRGKGHLDTEGRISLDELWSIALTDIPAIGEKIVAVSVAKEAKKEECKEDATSANSTNQPVYSPDQKDIGKPFAGYTDFADCVSQNKDKDDPKAYCATIMRKVEDTTKGDYVKKEEETKPEEKKDEVVVKEPAPPAPAPAPPKKEEEEEETDDEMDKKVLAEVLEIKKFLMEKLGGAPAPTEPAVAKEEIKKEVVAEVKKELAGSIEVVKASARPAEKKAESNEVSPLELLKNAKWY